MGIASCRGGGPRGAPGLLWPALRTFEFGLLAGISERQDPGLETTHLVLSLAPSSPAPLAVSVLSLPPPSHSGLPGDAAFCAASLSGPTPGTHQEELCLISRGSRGKVGWGAGAESGREQRCRDSGVRPEIKGRGGSDRLFLLVEIGPCLWVLICSSGRWVCRGRQWVVGAG